MQHQFLIPLNLSTECHTVNCMYIFHTLEQNPILLKMVSSISIVCVRHILFMTNEAFHIDVVVSTFLSSALRSIEFSLQKNKNWTEIENFYLIIWSICSLQYQWYLFIKIRTTLLALIIHRDGEENTIQFDKVF